MAFTIISLEQTAADCRAAADVIERNGLHKGSYYKVDDPTPPEKSPVCSAGAINVAVHGYPWAPTYNSEADCRSMAAFYAVSTHVNAASVALWNDEPFRTAEEVIAALRGAADKLEAEAAE